VEKVPFNIANINESRQYSSVFCTELLNVKSLQISFHADRYIIINFRCRFLPPPSQFRQSNTSSRKQFTSNTERH